MRIGRFTDPGNGAAFWASVDVERGAVQPIRGPIGEWGPGLAAAPGKAPPSAGPIRALETVQIVAPVEPHCKAIAAGATYAKHIAGLGLQMPKQPAAFIKPFQSLIGPGEEIAYPPITNALDYEGELVAVIGADVLGGGELESVLGYTIGNDVSARDLQFGGSVTGMDVFSSKALDNSSPVGPWIVTRDEFDQGSPDLELLVTVDDEVRQHDRTGSLVWGVGQLIEWVNARSSLHPGDLLFTGTPSGVGHEDGRYLEPGQRVVVALEGIGTLENTVGARR
jgi:2-keto-4-pentenoate hydratase/2-oxohepta-3-ene-1,7-dioic acid hydratase in catechol pathway